MSKNIVVDMIYACLPQASPVNNIILIVGVLQDQWVYILNVFSSSDTVWRYYR